MGRAGVMPASRARSNRCASRLKASALAAPELGPRAMPDPPKMSWKRSGCSSANGRKPSSAALARSRSGCDVIGVEFDLTHQELKSSLGQSPDEPVLGTEETVNRTNRAADLASDTAYREGFEATPGDKFLGRVEEGQSSLLVVQAWSSHTLQV